MQPAKTLRAINPNDRMKFIKSQTHLPDSTVSDVIPKTPGSAENPKQADMLYAETHAAQTQTADDFERVEVKQGVIGGVTCLVVDSRDLWKKMGVGSDFSNWIKDKLTYYEFIERVDFEVFSRLTRNSGLSPVNFGDSSQVRSFPLVYLLSLSAAKDIAYSERKPQAKQVRRHLKDCERRLTNAMLEGAVEAARRENEQISPAQSKVEMPKDALRVGDVDVLCKMTQAWKDRAWQLAMRQYGEMFLLSRDEKACQALAHAIQVRLFRQLERETEKMEEDVFTEPGTSKAISMIQQWKPAED